VNLPSIGEVTAAGKTAAQFFRMNWSAHKPQLRTVRWWVRWRAVLFKFCGFRRRVKTAEITIRPPHECVQAIMEAVASNEFGNLKEKSALSNGTCEQQSQVLDLESTLRGEHSGVLCQGRDVIFVHKVHF